MIVKSTDIVHLHDNNNGSYHVMVVRTMKYVMKWWWSNNTSSFLPWIMFAQGYFLIFWVFLVRQVDVWVVFLSEKWNISNPVNKSQVDATAVVRQELFDPCVIKWIIKYVSHKKLYLAVTLVSKFHPHTIRKWTYKVAKFTEMFATISLGSCLNY